MKPPDEDLLLGIPQQIAESDDPADDGINLSTLIKAGLQSAAPPDAGSMDHLCRCIDVSRALRTAYTKEWRRLDGSLEAPIELWIGTIALLLSSCERSLEEHKGDGRGLKYLNSALKALDLTLNLKPALNGVEGTEQPLQAMQIACLQRLANTLLATAITEKASS